MKSDELFGLLRRRGFLWPSAEIYGGVQGLYDYGPLGLALKRRIEDAWTAWFLGLSEDFYRIEASEILPEAVVRASGHLANFTDPEVTCASCKSVFRADSVLEKVRPEGVDGMSAEAIGELVRQTGAKCPKCGRATLGVPHAFNMMFGLDLGVTAGEKGYLRPETAQASYLAFPRMWEVGRKALPLGIAIVGRAFRNEIAPRQVLFRMREFTQAELQIFFDPERFNPPTDPILSEVLPMLRVSRRETGAESPEWVSIAALLKEGLPAFYLYHLWQAYRFFLDALGFPKDRVRLFEKSESERAFYNRIQFDIEAHLESLGGYRELGAVHYRGDYDLGRHAQGSGKDLSVLTEGGQRVVPHVLELTFGVDRNLWAQADAHLVREGERTVWKLPPSLAPLAAGVFPLLRKEHGEYARGLARELTEEGIAVEYDHAGGIGKRYARMDEAGVPFCITVDGETVDPANPHHDTVTLRERDSKAQHRIPRPELAPHIRRATRFLRPSA